MEIEFNCTYCNVELSAEAEDTGTTLPCPACGKEVLVLPPDPYAARKPNLAAPPPPGTSLKEIVCEACGETVQARIESKQLPLGIRIFVIFVSPILAPLVSGLLDGPNRYHCPECGHANRERLQGKDYVPMLIAAVIFIIIFVVLGILVWLEYKRNI